jgi:hypothetical protein
MKVNDGFPTIEFLENRRKLRFARIAPAYIGH